MLDTEIYIKKITRNNLLAVSPPNTELIFSRLYEKGKDFFLKERNETQGVQNTWGRSISNALNLMNTKTQTKYYWRPVDNDEW